MKIVLLILLTACASHGPEKIPLEKWKGKTLADVQEAFHDLTPKTELNKITYRDTDPIPSASRCSVIPCYPYMGKPRTNCTYVFKFENYVVKSATEQGKCRSNRRDPSSHQTSSF